MDTDTDDITSNGFGNTLTRDGQGSATANLPMNGFKHTGVGLGVATTDYATMGQLQGAAPAINWGVATGTSDAIAVAYTPALTALVDGQLCYFRAGFTNTTTTPTFSPNGLTAHTITKTGGNALAIGDIPGALAECILRYNAANTRWELLDPGSQVAGYAGSNATVTITIASPGVVTWTNHGLPANAQVEFSTTGSLPTGFSPATPYFVVQSSIAANTFQLSATKGGTAINTSGTQSGVHTGTSIALTGNLAAFSSSAGTAIKDGGPPLWGVPNLLASAVACGAVMLNGALVQSQAGGAQTFAIKTFAGGDPSAQDPVLFLFRDSVFANGDYSLLKATSALSVTIPSGATLGTVNATPARVWIVAYNNSGSVALGVINCLSGTSIYALSAWDIIGVATLNSSSNSALTIYGAAATSSYVPIGHATWEVGGTIGTAGTWNVAPTRLRLWQPGSALPGQMVQRQRNATGAVNTGTTTTSQADSVPTNAQGTQFMSQAVVPTSSANLLVIEHVGHYGEGSTAAELIAILLQDSTVNALASTITLLVNQPNNIVQIRLYHVMQAGIIVATTFKINVGSTGAGTLTFNGIASGRVLGGNLASYLEVSEMMA